MDPEITSEEIRRAQFRSALRGADREEVEAYLNSVALRVDQLEGERERLRAQLADAGAHDLESEFDEVGREVSTILQATRDAAESMRDRASLDATRWRSEAMSDAETERRDAASDAEALRRDAWTTGTDLLKQTSAESEKMREEAKRDVLTTMGEAEREAHRLTSGSRRDAEDRIRKATMNAEKITSEAEKRRDEIIDQATRQAGAAQERTRALEQRRDELLQELENVRSTLTRLEGSLEEKRESLDLTTESSSVKVVPQAAGAKTWEPGETVRVVQSEEPPPEPPPQPEMEEPVADTVEPEVAEETPEEKSDRSGDDGVDALFASLRDGGANDVPTTIDASDVETAEQAPTYSTDWIGERDTRLLPITNRALRGVKKAVTELQNIALDSLRTDEDWRPDATSISEAVRAELTTVWAESFAAGHSVAEEMTGDKLKRPRTPRIGIVKDFGVALGIAVEGALDDAGKGQRERQSAASKIYRVWRTDEAERRIREAAIDAFERGIEKSIPTEAPVG